MQHLVLLAENFILLGLALSGRWSRRLFLKFEEENILYYYLPSLVLILSLLLIFLIIVLVPSTLKPADQFKTYYKWNGFLFIFMLGFQECIFYVFREVSYLKTSTSTQKGGLALLSVCSIFLVIGFFFTLLGLCLNDPN